MAVGYFVCGTPRTGSTLLCSLLASTERLGRPESYFREPDEAAWAERFGLQTEGSRVRNYGAFVRALRETGTADNGVFAARVMWGSMERLLQGLGKAPREADLDVLDRAFGALRFVHLRREDVVAQAVSWCRAEQTGFWQQGDVVRRQPELDLHQLVELVRTISAHNAAWTAWFDRNAVQPHSVTYEELVQDGRAVVEGIAAHLGVTVPASWQPASSHRKQADEVNARWVVALRAARLS